MAAIRDVFEGASGAAAAALFVGAQTPLGHKFSQNKAGYTATPVGCGWAGAIFEVSEAFGQERYSQKPHKCQKSKV